MGLKNAKYGTVFLGKDDKTYGKEGTGTIAYDPDVECGGPIGTPGRQCPFVRDASTKPIADEDRKIHIAIPSFRDPLCPRTLLFIFTKSAKPENIFVRVLQQNEESDVDCFKEYCKLMDKEIEKQNLRGAAFEEECPFQNQIEVHPIAAQDAYGPTWARGMLSQQVRDAYDKGQVDTQDFCLSMDSHMDFFLNWDSSMIKMWNNAKNEYAVLSTYVEDRERMKGKNALVGKGLPHLCMVTFTSNVRVHATKLANQLSKPKLTNAIWGAGLSFKKCHAELKVPVDPHTPGIFDGEEFNRAARFWTYGYDIYTPNFTYIFHDYVTSQSNHNIHTWWRNNHKIKENQSNQRLLTLIDVPGGFTDSEEIMKLKRSKYGLGDRRTIDQLIQFSGIDLRHRKVTIDGKNRCGNIQWVPFTEHPKGPDYIPKFDENENPLDIPEKTSVWYNEKNNQNYNDEKQDEHISGEQRFSFKPEVEKILTSVIAYKKPEIPSSTATSTNVTYAFFEFMFIIAFLFFIGTLYSRKKETKMREL